VHRISWLVVAERARGTGVGRALVEYALRTHMSAAERVDVLTFGADHPAAVQGGARVFYERLGFRAGEPGPPGPEGGSRQWYHLSR
jgi:GNAT superfamily N-acetyltransferase